jgi:hypothetical protein
LIFPKILADRNVTEVSIQTRYRNFRVHQGRLPW